MKTTENNKFDINKFGIACNGARVYYDTKDTFEEAWNDCHRGEWMLWIASKLGVNKRIITLTKGYCAKTVIHLMKDQRSIDAVKIAIKYGRYKATENELNSVADAAVAAAAYYAAAYYADAAASAAVAAYDADYTAADAAAYAAAYYAVADAYDADAAAYAAADAAADAYDADRVATYASDASDAYIENQQQTANICKKYLTKEVFKLIRANN